MTVYDFADRPAIWWANVSYSVDGQTYLATVPAARVRLVEE